MSITSDDYALLIVIANQKERFKNPDEMLLYDLPNRLSEYGNKIANYILDIPSIYDEEVIIASKVIMKSVEERNNRARY